MAFSILLGLFVFVAAILAGAGLIAKKSPLLMMATLVWVLAAWQGFSEAEATWDTNYVIGFVTIFAAIGSAILSLFVREDKRDEIEVEKTPDDIFNEEEPDEETAEAASRRAKRQERHNEKHKGRRKTDRVREKAKDKRFRLTGRP